MKERILKFRVYHRLSMHYKDVDMFISFENDGSVNNASSFTTSVMQFTGLKDKNGKEIYESDFLKHINLHEDNDIAFVVYREGSFRLAKKIDPEKPWDGEVRMWKDGTHDWYSIENLESYEIEVIGNIYENPELLIDSNK